MPRAIGHETSYFDVFLIFSFVDSVLWFYFIFISFSNSKADPYRNSTQGNLLLGALEQALHASEYPTITFICPTWAYLAVYSKGAYFFSCVHVGMRGDMRQKKFLQSHRRRRPDPSSMEDHFHWFSIISKSPIKPRVWSFPARHNLPWRCRWPYDPKHE